MIGQGVKMEEHRERFYHFQEERIRRRLEEILLLPSSEKMKALIRFHSENKYLFFCYDQKIKDQLGKMLANHSKEKSDPIARRYRATVCELFLQMPSIANEINSLMHMFGYFKKDLTEEDKRSFLELIDDYREHRIDGTRIRELLRDYAIRYGKVYLSSQTILEPFPWGCAEIPEEEYEGKEDVHPALLKTKARKSNEE